jgi:hypothetical protein
MIPSSLFLAAPPLELDGWLQTGVLGALLFFLLRWLLSHFAKQADKSDKERATLVGGLTEAIDELKRSREMAERESIAAASSHLELVRTQKEILATLAELSSDRDKGLEVQGALLEQIGKLRAEVREVRDAGTA